MIASPDEGGSDRPDQESCRRCERMVGRSPATQPSDPGQHGQARNLLRSIFLVASLTIIFPYPPPAQIFAAGRRHPATTHRLLGSVRGPGHEGLVPPTDRTGSRLTIMRAADLLACGIDNARSGMLESRSTFCAEQRAW